MPSAMMAEEVFEHHYEQVRFEIAKFPLYDIKSIIYYCMKYGKKKRSANQALLSHFHEEKIRAPLRHPRLIRSEKHSSASDLKVSLTGDIMWIRKGWNEFLSGEVLSFLQSRDIVLGNLETPVSPDHEVVDCMPDLFSYNSPPAMLDHLAQCFTAVSIINNHSLDQGVAGLCNTIRELDARDILSTGACVGDQGRECLVMTRKDFRVGFLAYAWGLNTAKYPDAQCPARLNIMNLVDPAKPLGYALIEEHIHRMHAENVDLIICSLHWGYEFEMYPTYHLMKVARHLVSLGVDVIMGHHPHVLQPFEIVDVNADRPFDFQNIQDRSRPEARKAVVLYSLGNFASAMYTRECLQSCVFNLNYVKQDGLTMLDGISYIPTYCLKKRRGGSGVAVVSLPAELEKGRLAKSNHVLRDSYRDITEHLGKAFLM